MQFDLCSTARSKQFDWSFLKLKGFEPERQEIQTNNQRIRQYWKFDQESATELNVFNPFHFIYNNSISVDISFISWRITKNKNLFSGFRLLSKTLFKLLYNFQDQEHLSKLPMYINMRLLNFSKLFFMFSINTLLFLIVFWGISTMMLSRLMILWRATILLLRV